MSILDMSIRGMWNKTKESATSTVKNIDEATKLARAKLRAHTEALKAAAETARAYISELRQEKKDFMKTFRSEKKKVSEIRAKKYAEVYQATLKVVCKDLGITVPKPEPEPEQKSE